MRESTWGREASVVEASSLGKPDVSSEDATGRSPATQLDATEHVLGGPEPCRPHLARTAQAGPRQHPRVVMVHWDWGLA